MDKIKSNLNKELNLIKNTQGNTWIGIILIILLFVLVPMFGIDAWYKYFDNNIYYEVINPVEIVEKDIKPCDIITLQFRIKSKIDSVGTSHRAFMKVEMLKESDIRISTQIVEIPITKTNDYEIKNIQIQIPCDVDNGSYYFYSILEFKVRDITKYSYWRSITFPINKFIINQT